MTKFVALHGGTNPREVVNAEEKIVGKSSHLSLKHEEKEIIILHQVQTVSQIHKNKMKVWLLEVVVEINFTELSSIQPTDCVYYGLIFYTNDDSLPNRLAFVSEMQYKIYS